jgi:hypothetical protein
MLGIEQQHDQEVQEAMSDGKSYVWYFLVTHKSGKWLPPGQERFFYVTGSYPEAKVKAQAEGKRLGCVDGKDVILQLGFRALELGPDRNRRNV